MAGGAEAVYHRASQLLLIQLSMLISNRREFIFAYSVREKAGDPVTRGEVLEGERSTFKLQPVS